MTSNNEPTRERIEAAKEHAEKGAQYYNGALNDYKNKFKKEPEMFLEGEYDATFDYIENRIEYYDTYLALANAELERQSVTEEDVAEAIERVNEQINTLADIIDELVEEQGEEAMVRDVKEALRTEITCLAALEAVRWRDAAVEWPEEEMHMVVKISFISVPIVAYKPEKSEHVQLPNSYGAEYSRSVIKKYLPLPKWEEEAINRAFDDDHRGIGLTD